MSKIIVGFVFSLICSIAALHAQVTDTFNIRGVLPWHNFLSGPTSWNVEDYRIYLDECQQQHINFIGFHNYTGGGERYATYVEPMIKIEYKHILNILNSKLQKLILQINKELIQLLKMK